jgi:hypothetical protein
VEDTSETWVDLGLTNGLTLSTAQELWALSREILVRNIQLARAGIISFDDQIYCSTLLGGHFTKFPTVFVDEDQDLSPLDILMVSKALAPTGRLFAVGDKRQAIYAFRGASGEAAELIRKLRPSEEWTDHPLMLSFRCPQLVAERQQFHAPGFRAWHTNPQGRVERWQALPEGDEVWDGWTTKSIANAMPQSNSTVAILCRNNGPLFSMAFKLLRQSIGVQMLGRDFGKGLVALSKKIEPNDATEIQRFVHKLLDWKEKEIAQLLAVKKDEKIEFVLDKHECFLAVIESGGARTTGELRGLLEKLFARDSGLITLGSIHRAKGLEWDLVIHLDPWRIPSKQAKAMANAGDPIPLQQEWNLNYVVETRTKHTLVLADKSGFR